MDITGIEVTPTSIKLSWIDLSRERQKGIIAAYNVTAEATLANNTVHIIPLVTLHNATNATVHFMGQLFPYTNYSVNISSCNDDLDCGDPRMLYVLTNETGMGLVFYFNALVSYFLFLIVGGAIAGGC